METSIINLSMRYQRLEIISIFLYKKTTSQAQCQQLKKKEEIQCKVSSFFDIIQAGVRMKNDIKCRLKKLRNFIYDEKTREKCRLQDEKHKRTFTRNRKLPFYDILLMTLNKQGKNISFEIRDYELNKKGEEQVNYTDEAYLKQRRNLNPDVFKEMNRLYLKDFYEKPKYIKKKKGYS